MPKHTENSKRAKKPVWRAETGQCRAQRCTMASFRLRHTLEKPKSTSKLEMARNDSSIVINGPLLLCNAIRPRRHKKAATSRRAACVCKSPHSRDEVVTHHHFQLLSAHDRLNKDRSFSRFVVRFGKVLSCKRGFCERSAAFLKVSIAAKNTFGTTAPPHTPRRVVKTYQQLELTVV